MFCAEQTETVAQLDLFAWSSTNDKIARLLPISGHLEPGIHQSFYIKASKNIHVSLWETETPHLTSYSSWSIFLSSMHELDCLVNTYPMSSRRFQWRRFRVHDLKYTNSLIRSFQAPLQYIIQLVYLRIVMTAYCCLWTEQDSLRANYRASVCKGYTAATKQRTCWHGTHWFRKKK